MKSIEQFPIIGEHLKTFKGSPTEIEQEFSIPWEDIEKVCRHENATSHGFIWQFSEDIQLGRHLEKQFNGIAVNQYDLEGKFIQQWFSVSKAESELKCNIRKCLSGEGLTAGGFVWEKAEEELPSLTITPPPFNINKIKRYTGKVYQFTLDGKFVKEWENAATAGRSLGYKDGRQISKFFYGRVKSAYGYIWKREKDIRSVHEKYQD